jgi:hypothetical protein
LDVGCGRNATLVEMFRKEGCDAYGVDQYLSEYPNIFCSNWLDFDYRQKEWGAVYSHMAFSNHFNRAQATSPTNAERFRVKLGEILQSLASGGFFVFSPSIQNIERLVSDTKFEICQFENVPGIPMLNTTIVKKNIVQ